MILVLSSNYLFGPHIEVKIVKQMPVQTPGKKPTVAIITSKYYEKLAVDAMMEDKTTFVKYKTEGRVFPLELLFFRFNFSYRAYVFLCI